MNFHTIYKYVSKPKLIFGLLMLGAGNVITACSSKSLRRSVNLPVSGPIRFIPRRADILRCRLHKIDGGYMDRFGNIWVKPRGLIIGEFHWDVQIASNNEELRRWSNSGSHVNVTQDGRIAH